MSTAEFEQRLRQSRRTCTCCRERRSRYRYNGAVRADRHAACRQARGIRSWIRPRVTIPRRADREQV